MQNIIIMRKKFQEDVVNLINESGLPAFIMKDTLRNLIPLLEKLEAQQLQQAEQAEKAEEEAEKDG